MSNFTSDDKATASDRSTYFHKEWIGMLQPVGLVVEATALAQAQMSVDRDRLVELQQQFQGLVTVGNLPGRSDYKEAWLGGDRFQELLTQFLRWPVKTIAGLGNKAGDWIMVVKVVPLGWDLDQDEPGAEHKWKATPQQKLKRLLLLLLLLRGTQ